MSVLPLYNLCPSIFKWSPCARVDEDQQPRQYIQNNNMNGTKDYSQKEECEWGRYARGAVFALRSRGNSLSQVRKYVLAVYSVVHLSSRSLYYEFK